MPLLFRFLPASHHSPKLFFPPTRPRGVCGLFLRRPIPKASIGVTPAMASGISAHAWTVAEIVSRVG